MIISEQKLKNLGTPIILTNQDKQLFIYEGNEPVDIIDKEIIARFRYDIREFTKTHSTIKTID
jgi:hypothetical protein